MTPFATVPTTLFFLHSSTAETRSAVCVAIGTTNSFLGDTLSRRRAFRRVFLGMYGDGKSCSCLEWDFVETFKNTSVEFLVFYALLG